MKQKGRMTRAEKMRDPERRKQYEERNPKVRVEGGNRQEARRDTHNPPGATDHLASLV